MSLWLTSISMTDDYCYSVCMCPQYDWRRGHRLPNAIHLKNHSSKYKKKLVQNYKETISNTNIYSPPLSSLRECIYRTLSYILTIYFTFQVPVTRVAGIFTIPFSLQNNCNLFILSQQKMKVKFKEVWVLKIML